MKHKSYITKNINNNNNNNNNNNKLWRSWPEMKLHKRYTQRNNGTLAMEPNDLCLFERSLPVVRISLLFGVH
jgi:hypothetical protein